MFYKFEFEHKRVSVEHNIISFAVNTIQEASMSFHSHIYTEIIIPFNCKGKIVDSLNSHSAEADTVYVIPPNISHTEEPLDNNFSFDYYTIKIKDIIPIKDSENEIMAIKFSREQYSDMLSNLRLGAKYIQSSNKNENLAMLNIICFYQLFTEFLSEKEIVLQAFQHNEIIPSYVIEIEKFITRNCHIEVKVEELAKQYGISRSTLEKKFKKAVGKTLKEYVQKTRLDTAVYLLQTSDMSITQIFSMAGYASASYFIRIFKMNYGVTPSVFRKEHRSK